MSLPDRVKETTTSTGTGNLTLLGAVGQFQALSAAFTPAQTGITLCIADQSGLNWEVSSCTYINATTISRDVVLSSSNSGSLVNFSAGTKDVFYTLSAADIAKLAGSVSAAATTIAATATSKLLIVESGMPKQITIDNFLSSVGQTSGALTAAGALAGSNIIVVSQDGGATEVRTTLTALAAYVASTLVGATAVTMSGPASGNTGVASTNFSIAANGTITGTVIVTPSDAGNGGTFSPTTVSISSGSPTATFTYTPASTGAKTISVTNNGSLTNPSNITYTSNAAAATAVTMTGPTSGVELVASTNFTIAANGSISGTVIVTPSAIGGGTFTPTTVSISSGTPTATFTYTPATTGSKTISVTNNGALSNPVNITYTSNASGVAYTITGYSGNSVKTTLSATGATVFAPLKLLPASGNFSASIYWSTAPSAPSCKSGWGTSNVTPPAEITSGQNASSGTSVNGMIPMTSAAAFGDQSNLWVTSGSGTSTWYFWIKPSDGVAQCMNPSGMTVTGA